MENITPLSLSHPFLPRVLTHHALRALLRWRLIFQTSLLRSYMRYRAWSTGRVNIGLEADPSRHSWIICIPKCNETRFSQFCLFRETWKRPIVWFCNAAPQIISWILQIFVATHATKLMYVAYLRTESSIIIAWNDGWKLVAYYQKWP